MNKTAIKTFAVRARIKLMQDITQKAYELGITQDEVKSIETFEGGFKIKGLDNSKTYKTYQVRQREKLVTNIGEKGFDQVVEEVAYTWFNRFIALRFMEVNEYLPTGVRVLSSIEEGKIEPDIIREALNVDLDLDTELVYKLIDADDTVDLYKYLIIKQCNQLGEIMPMVFESISDYTELLLPDNLIDEGSVVRDLVESIEEEDYKDQVEIIGWMYQYYISEKKDEVFTDLKKNIKITKENIPAATQLFTPKWIVKYMVENSLGRLWLESQPDEELQAQWKYYLEEADQDPEVQEKLDELKDPNLNPEDIKILDPSMGSGHILVYAFDVLYDIYLKANYSERDIPQLILEKNLYGLDIDDRAGQLAAFALMMKARSKNRRIFRRKVKLNICSIQETNTIPKEAIDFLVSPKDTAIEKMANREDIDYLIEVFNDAKEYGSILDVKNIDFDAIERRIEQIKDGKTLDLFEFEYREIILEKLPQLLKQARIMSEKYDVICTNPPYMGRNGMNNKLKKYVDKRLPNSKNDLFAIFIELDNFYLKDYGFYAMINQHSWMFLASFEKLRKEIIDKREIYNMLHLGPRAFEEISGEVVQSTTYVQRKVKIKDYKGRYVRLIDYNNPKKKETKFLEIIKQYNSRDLYLATIQNLNSIPGIPIAYWINDSLLKMFEKQSKLEKNAYPVEGIKTGNNNLFLRFWHEIDFEKMALIESKSMGSNLRWYPMAKGGAFRKWYGNIDFVIDWEDNGRRVMDYEKSTVSNKHLFFTQAITWTYISTNKISMRYLGDNILYNNKGPGCYFDNIDDLYYSLAALNSVIGDVIMEILAPTMDFKPGNIKNFPLKFPEVNQIKDKIISIVKACIDISKKDWDSFETSFDFKKHIFLKELKDQKGFNSKIETAFVTGSNFKNKQFNRLKSSEEELNRMFINIYGLQERLNPEVEDKDITISKADQEIDIKSFVSYAVGCMFGRYSLDEDGLIYAGGDLKDKFRFEDGILKTKTTQGWKDLSFDITMDNILVIADDDYFEDDIVNRFIDFVKTTFGEETLEENLDYIAQTLKMKSNETSRQAIRRYFLKDFYKDHVQTYKKTPIYWLFDSGKQNGFKALIYMHRYDVSTVARVRTDYLHKLQKSYEAEVNRLNILLESDLSPRDKAAAMKKKDVITKQIIECAAYDQVIAHVANSRIEIDLDDGVKVNYAKFQGIKVPQGEGKKVLTQDLLAKL